MQLCTEANGINNSDTGLSDCNQALTVNLPLAEEWHEILCEKTAVG